MDKFEKKMKDAGLNEAAIAAFRLNYDQLTQGATGMVCELILILFQQKDEIRSLLILCLSRFLRKRSTPSANYRGWTQ